MMQVDALHKAAQYNSPGVALGTKPPGSLCCFINTTNPGFQILKSIAKSAQKEFRKAKGAKEIQLAKTLLASSCFYQKQPRKKPLSDCLEMNHRSRLTDVTRAIVRLVDFAQQLNDGNADVDTIQLGGDKGIVLCKAQKTGDHNGTSLAMKFTAKLVECMTHFTTYPTLHELDTERQSRWPRKTFKMCGVRCICVMGSSRLCSGRLPCTTPTTTPSSGFTLYFSTRLLHLRMPSHSLTNLGLWTTTHPATPSVRDHAFVSN